jgi:hypothetical protein
MRPGTHFLATQTRPAGHIFFIPGDERPGDDPKTRPHFLANRCDPSVDPYVLATLAHMTTKPTEIVSHGSAGHQLADPAKPDGSFVIATRLLPRSATNLTRSHLSATEHVRAVRTSVLQAVGIGEGLGPRGSASVRGRLVRILDPRAGFQHGFILTAHEYSRRRRFQVVVPVIDRVVETDDGMEELEITPWDVLPERRHWFEQVPSAEPLLETAALISLTEEWQGGRDSRTWLKKQIEVLEPTIDASTLSVVEARIGARLAL